MTAIDLATQFESLNFHEKMTVALLAIAGEPMGRTRIYDHLAAADIRDDDDLLAAVDTATVDLARCTRNPNAPNIIYHFFHWR